MQRKKKNDSRLPDGPLTLESTGGTEEYGQAFLQSLRDLVSKEKTLETAAAIPSEDILAYSEKLSKMSMSEDTVAKVCPDRIYSITTFPSDTLLVAAGDKAGNLGLWSVDDASKASEDTDGVVLYKPHSSTINRLMFDHASSSKLYSFSYDGSVRCMDIVKGIFDQSFSLPDSEDDGSVWLQHGVLASDGTLYVGDSSGRLFTADPRKGCGDKSIVHNFCAHDKKVQTVDVNGFYLATASLDRSVKLFDVRKFGSKKPKPVFTSPDSRSVNCAYFSRNGDHLLTVAMSNRLCLINDPCTKKSGLVIPDHDVRHDNRTGRYLPVFHASWDPANNHTFVVGSMCRPRQVEVYSADGGKLKRIMVFQDPDYLNSVQSRNTFHSHGGTRGIVCGNASGRVHIFR